MSWNDRFNEADVGGFRARPTAPEAPALGGRQRVAGPKHLAGSARAARVTLSRGWLRGLLLYLGLGSLVCSAQEFRIRSVSMGASGIEIVHEAGLAYYYLLLRGDTTEAITRPVAMQLGNAMDESTGLGVVRDEAPPATSPQFYRVVRYSVLEPGDFDGDTFNDVWELSAETDPLSALSSPQNALAPVSVGLVAPVIPTGDSGFPLGTWVSAGASETGAASVALVLPTLPRDESGVPLGSFPSHPQASVE